MEGFTSSLHVKGASTKRVEEAVTSLLSSEGFQVSSADDSTAATDDQTTTRGVWISKAKGDWVAIFCSDFLFQQEIGRELSRILDTHALHVWLNEGSSWHYSLFQGGEEVDQFDSSGDDEFEEYLDDEAEDELDGDDFDDEDEEDDFGSSDGGEESGPMQEGLARIAELQERISEKMPEDVREIYEKLQNGRASLGEMRRFDQWSQANQAELSSFQEQMQEQTAELTAAMQGMFQGNAQGDNPLGAAGDMLKGMLPPDMAELFGKVLSGEASPDELQRLAGLQSEDDDELPLVNGEVGDGAEDDEGDDVEEAFFGSDDEDAEDDGDEAERSAEHEQAIQTHLGALQPLFSKSVDPTEVAETLAAQDESPEQPLGEFLSYLGIDSGFSELDFDCLEQLSSEELAEQGIKLNPLLLVRSE